MKGFCFIQIIIFLSHQLYPPGTLLFTLLNRHIHSAPQCLHSSHLKITIFFLLCFYVDHGTKNKDGSFFIPLLHRWPLLKRPKRKRLLPMPLKIRWTEVHFNLSLSAAFIKSYLWLSNTEAIQWAVTPSSVLFLLLELRMLLNLKSNIYF